MDLPRYDAFVAEHFDPDSGDPRRFDLPRGPASLPSLAAAIECLMDNPNLASLAGSGGYLAVERAAVAALADLTLGEGHTATGFFTAGGTLSNLYGAKLGIERVAPGAMRTGVPAGLIGVASEAAHFSVRSVAGWLGIGSCNLVLIPTGANCAMRLDLLNDALDWLHREGKTVAFAVGTLGTTCAGGIDDLAGMRTILDAQADRHGRPRPHLHADAAVGWSLGWLNGYDTAANPLKLDAAILPGVAKLPGICAGLRHADSITLDPHKLGRAHTPSSCFIVKDRATLEPLARELPYLDADAPARHTLETTRPGVGAATAWANLQAFGRKGWQMLVGRGLELAEHLKGRLDRVEGCTVINREGVGPSVAFRKEMNGLTRLGFTTDVGFDHRSAWVAHFYHPATTEAMIGEMLGEDTRRG